MGRHERSGRPRVALVGRPNVGKSTLFNRLLGRREAIVLDRPGVTRDRIERPCCIGGVDVLLEDTGGLVPLEQEELVAEVSRQALSAVTDADVVVLVLDGRAGITPLDRLISGHLRSAGARVVLVVNKIDTPRQEALVLEAWELGLGEPTPLSAEHGLGIGELSDRVAHELQALDGAPADGEEGPETGGELSIAVVGRPNVGKSSIVNRLAGSARVTVSSVPGTTRDAIDVLLTRDGRRFRLVDTAGLRRRSKVETPDESIGIMFTRRRLQRADVALLVVDATVGITSQDVGIAGEIVRAGRPFLVAANKWDLVEGREQAQKDLSDAVSRRLAFAAWAPLMTVSAVSGRRIHRLLDEAARIAEASRTRIPTASLNRFLQSVVGELISAGGSGPKALYMTQTGFAPPRFVIFVRGSARPDEGFRRFVERRLRETFGLGPTPVLVQFRASPRR